MELFNMPTWIKDDLRKESIREVAKKLSFGTPAIPERIFALHDTLNLISQLFQKDVIFSGGSMINPLYIQEAPRLSIDIDLIFKKPIEKKDDLIKSIIDRQGILVQKGYTAFLDFDALTTDVGFLEVDIKRQHLYPDVLFLTRKCVTNFVGTPLTTYLKQRGAQLKSRNDLAKFKHLKKNFGGEPRFYAIRCEILYSNEGSSIKFEPKTIPPYFPQVLSPKNNPKLDVETPLEFCEGKLNLIEILPEEQTQNILNAFLDLRVLGKLDLRINIPSKIIKKLESINQNLGKEYNNLFAYAYIRKKFSWNALYGKIMNILKTK